MTPGQPAKAQPIAEMMRDDDAGNQREQQLGGNDLYEVPRVFRHIQKIASFRHLGEGRHDQMSGYQMTESQHALEHGIEGGQGL